MDKERAPQRVALALLAAMAVGCVTKPQRTVDVLVNYVGCDNSTIGEPKTISVRDLDGNGKVDQGKEMDALEKGAKKNCPKGFQLKNCQPVSPQMIECFSECP